MWPRPEALLSLVDFPVVSERLAEEFGGTGRVRDGLRTLFSHGATLAVATQGERGATALGSTGWVESAGFAIKPVDTTGAGDGFRAGFVWGVLEGKSATDVLRIANASGALNCLALGAQPGLPTREDVETLVTSQALGETNAMRNSKTTSGRAMLVVTLLLLAVGAGGYNYHRNLVAETVEQGGRPFKGYADQDLVDLKAAYGMQVDSRKGDYDRLAKRRQKSASNKELLAEKILNFERIQRAGDEKRAMAGFVAENQARVQEIEAELAYRQSLNAGLAVHIKRLTTI